LSGACPWKFTSSPWKDGSFCGYCLWWPVGWPCAKAEAWEKPGWL